jgi:hypothetical protein
MLTLKVTEDRMKGLKIGVLRKIETSPASQFAFIAHFMTGESGDYLSTDAAYEILDELALSDIEEITGQLKEAMDEAAFPKKQGQR